MRRASIWLVAALGFAAAANASSLNPDRIKEIDRAADAFLAKAAAAKQAGMMPRQSDPSVAPLLDAVFDTRDLSHGPLPYADLDALQDWLTRIAAVGGVYVAGSRTVHDAGIFGPEMGRFVDAASVVMQAVADCMAAELAAHSGRKLSQSESHDTEQMRAEITGNVGRFVAAFLEPGRTVGWVRDRLTVLIAAAPSFARFLTPPELSRLRGTTLHMARQVRDKSLRAKFDGLAMALTEAAPPIAPSQAPAGNEIALEADGGGGYSVPVRINGALTVKFIVDSGASVVALPQDLVDALTKSGGLASSDLQGHMTYVAADGKRHRAARLTLRQLDVGGHTVANVEASVIPGHAPPLLGMSFLAKFRSWTLDNRRHVLIVSE